MLCKCGCRQELPEGYKREYLYGHRTSAANSTEMIPCACGCGKMKRKFDKSGQIAPIYLKGHNPLSIAALPHGSGPDNNFYGHHHTEERKRAQSIKMKVWHETNENPFKGKHHTEETKRILSIKLTGKAPPPFTEDHRRKLRDANERNREQNAESTRKLWKDPKYRNAIISKTTGQTRSPEVKEKMSKARAAVGNPSGPKASNWQGGKSFGPYSIGFNRKRREKVRRRDKRTCQLCGMTSKEQGQALDVHHWDYDKSKTDPYYFVALCHSCHSKTQGKYIREYYEELFRQMMQERFPKHE